MGYRRAFGVDAPPCSYDDLNHTDCVFIIGSNTAYCHPVLFMQLAELKEVKGERLKIIVADPRKTPTAGIADIYIPVKPGTDVALINSFIHVLIKERLIDREFISSHTEGFEELEKTVERYSPEKAALICEIPSSLIREAALVYGRANSALTLWTMGLNQSSHGTDKNNAAINLSLVTGNIGRNGAGPFSLTGQSNAMGGRETGGLANLLPGHRYMENAAHRQEVDTIWRCGEMSTAKGLTAVELFDSIHRGIVKAVWIICTNPAVSLPNGSKFEKALERAELVVVQDLFSPTDTALFADVILPAAGFGEKEGTMTNSERRVSHISKAVEPPGEALPDWEILTRFARYIGLAEFFPYDNSEDVFEEYKLLTRGRDMDISGITYERLQTDGPIQWPCPDENHSGTARLYGDGVFPTENGRAKLIPIEYLPQAEPPDSDFPLTLTTGRFRDQWHTMTKTGKVESLMQNQPDPNLEIHPIDAERYGLKDGDLAVVESRRGGVTVRTTATDRIKEGTVFLPFHWGKLLADNGRTNLMTVEALDPISKQPEFKACAVRVGKKSLTERTNIVIAGDDSAGLSVARKVIATNPNAQAILVGGNAELNTFSESIKIQEGVIATIDSHNQRVVLEDGSSFSYEKLVLASGCRFYVPPISGLSLQGVVIIENPEQARRAIAKLHTIKEPIVIGQGPLSLEIACQLRNRGVENVELMNPSTVLLDKELDGKASELLYYELKKRGIRVTLGVEIESIIGSGSVEGVQLARGEFRKADLIFVETRIRPDVELAFKAGIHVNKGIVVGDRLETSAPFIYAVGSAAEIQGFTSGDPQAVSRQAEILSSLLAGDPTSRYRDFISCNRINVLGLPLISFGEFNSDDEESNVLSYLDRSKSVYKKIVIRNNRIVGGLFFGDASPCEEILELAVKRTDVSAYRQKLLSGNLERRMPAGKVLCSCTGVTREEIQAAVKGGVREVEALRENLKVAVTCGTCLQDLKELVKAMN